MIDKAKLLRALKADRKAAEHVKLQWDEKRKLWINATEGLPYGNEEEDKSAIVSKDIKKQLEWQHSKIIDPFVSSNDIVKCFPVTFEDTKASEQNELLLNTQFCRKFDRFNFMSKAIKILEREGTVVIQTGWDYEDKEVDMDTEVVSTNEYGQEYIETKKTTQTIVKKNQPTAVVCRNEDIFLDPTCQDDMDKCQFVIYRYESDISTLKKDGRFKNLDRVSKSLGSTTYDYSYYPQDTSRFQFEDDARKKLIVYEYWGNYDINEDGVTEAIVCVWVGDTIIRLETNPYPDGKPPFIIVPFNAIPFQMYGEANAELIGDNQKIKTAVIRGIIDNMAQSNNGQIGVKKGALDPINRKKWLQGKNFEFNGGIGDFWQGSYNVIPSSAFDLIGLMNNEMESLTGIKSFSGGITGASLGGTATAARGVQDATSVRNMNIVRNIAENLVKPLLRKWMSYNSEFLEEEEVVRITNEEFVPVRKDDLDGSVDVDLTIATLEDQSAKAQELSFLLQTIGNSIDPGVTHEIMAQILELSRMPEQAKKIRDFKPEPDPMEEQLKQLQLQRMQLENAKLQSEITRNESIAAENEIDKQVKLAKAAKDEATARNIHSKTDLSDLTFLRIESGKEDSAKLKAEELRHLSSLDMKAFDANVKEKDNKLKVLLKELDHKSKLDTMAFDAMQKDKDRKNKEVTNG
ncbi:MAG: cell envelope integrity protein TolA [Ignisphaera sp.]|nr:cell envelope integrity protein TolA [Ignisphaera sp.]